MNFPYKRVVMVSPRRLGDTIFCTPAIRFLKKCCPEIRLDIIALSEIAEGALEHNPSIDHLWFRPNKRETKDKRGFYDIGINIHRSQEATEYFTRLGVEVLEVPLRDYNIHQASDLLRFISRLVGKQPDGDDYRYFLYPQESNFTNAKNLLLSHHVDIKRESLIGIQLGVHSTSKGGRKFWKPLRHPKMWPIENYLQLESTLKDINNRIKFVLVGSKGERALANRFKKKSVDAINLVGETSILDLAALMTYFRIFISPDTGPLHIACAMGINVVALFGPTNYRHTGPYPGGDNTRVISAGNMSKILPEDIVKTIQRLTQL